MISLRDGCLEHQFDDVSGWTASKYDEWRYYRDHFGGAFGGNKAVDIIAHDPQNTVWLVELKDYRVHPRAKPGDLADEIAVKIRDSLAGIFAAAKSPNEHARSSDAKRHLAATKYRVVLHLEQPQRHSKLFPKVSEVSNLQQKLKQLVGVLDPHPMVVDLESCSRLPWCVVAVSGESAPGEANASGKRYVREEK